MNPSPRHPSVLPRAATALAWLALLAGPATSISPQGESIWHSDFASAREAAEAGKKLLLIGFNADIGGEAGNHRMAHDVYRDPHFHRAASGIIALIASPDEHTGNGCDRFDGIGCAAHRQIEKDARRFLFGDARDIVAPQHVLLFPDGAVAWHALYEVSSATLVREINKAGITWKKNARVRQSAQLTRLSKLISGAKSDAERYWVLRTTLCHASVDLFPKMVRKIVDPVLAARLLRDLAVQWPDRAEPRLAALDGNCDQQLLAVVAECQAQLATNGVRAFEGDEAVPAQEIPDLGKAEKIHRVHFLDGADHEIGGQPGHLTVLLFFLPGDANLATQVERWNRFVERSDRERVLTYALGASVVPETDLSVIETAGFGFPAGNYLYEEAIAPYGITSFPQAVVLDPEGRVLFNGDAYNGFEKAVTSALRRLGDAER